jgi:hypothetical protein
MGGGGQKMMRSRHAKTLRTIPFLIATCLIGLPASAQYSGGTGEPNDPYQIATAADLIALGETPEDYNKHFILTADIDMDPNLPGRKVFDRAVIAPDSKLPFTGIFDGDGHVVSHLTIRSGGYFKVYIGLFGQLGKHPSLSEVKDLGVVDVNITRSGEYKGGLVGYNRHGSLTRCYSTGVVSGTDGAPRVGGLVGYNGAGIVTQCYSIARVAGSNVVGGLVGWNQSGRIVSCYAAGTVSGTSIEESQFIGTLVGGNNGSITSCYSSARVSGNSRYGGLVGGSSPGRVKYSVWDVETSGVLRGDAGVGLTTAEMMDPYMLGLNGFCRDPNWVLDPGHDYPRLAWEGTPGDVIPEPDIDWLQGGGTTDGPYRIETANQLILLSRASILWDAHFVLIADIDLDPNLPGRKVFQQAVIPAFTGVFDGNDRTISHLTIKGESYLGLLGQLGFAGSVSNLGLEALEINGTGKYVGGLVGLKSWGEVTQCSSSGAIAGGACVGGLVGRNWEGKVAQSYSTAAVSGDSDIGGLGGDNPGGPVTQCYSTGAISGNTSVGGLVGMNADVVTYCCSTGTVVGESDVGGLVGRNGWEVTDCYAMCIVRGDTSVGGLVGANHFLFQGRPLLGRVNRCYSCGTVSGSEYVGGLVGSNHYSGYYDWSAIEGEGVVSESFWDTETSGQATSAGGAGRTTAEMQTASTFLDAGWDFIGETANGTADLWWILEGQDYPRLWWELGEMGVDSDGTADEQR